VRMVKMEIMKDLRGYFWVEELEGKMLRVMKM